MTTRRISSALLGMIAGALASACQQTPRTAVAPAPVVAVAGGTKPVAIAGVVIDVPGSTRIGEVTYGIGCAGVAGPLTVGGGDITEANLQRALRDRLSAAGVTVVGGRETLFQEPGGPDAELQLGALVTAIDADACFPTLYHLRDLTDIDAEASLSVTWQIYSPLDRRIVLETTSSGIGNSGVSLDDAAYRAVASAADGLLRHPAFLDLVRNRGGSVPAAESAAGLRVSVPAEPALTGTVRTNMARIGAAVVTVFSTRGQGSGFFIDAAGQLLTNAHVVGTSGKARVRLASGREVAASVLAADPRRDVALLKIEGSAPAFLPIGSAAGLVGADVYAVGSPLDEDFQATLSKGVLSAERRFDGLRFLQSDVNVQHGSSGGPLLDEHGNVIGITQSGVEAYGVPAGINLFIPIDEVVSPGSPSRRR